MAGFDGNLEPVVEQRRIVSLLFTDVPERSATVDEYILKERSKWTGAKGTAADEIQDAARIEPVGAGPRTDLSTAGNLDIEMQPLRGRESKRAGFFCGLQRSSGRRMDGFF